MLREDNGHFFIHLNYYSTTMMVFFFFYLPETLMKKLLKDLFQVEEN